MKHNTNNISNERDISNAQRLFIRDEKKKQ